MGEVLSFCGLYAASVSICVYFARWYFDRNVSLATYLQRQAARENFDASLNGLRGLLALSVYLSHVEAFHNLFLNWPSKIWVSTTWLAPAVGATAVRLFFCLSGFLMWRGLIDGEYRLAPTAFLKARVRRIAPAYYATLLALLIICVLESNFRIQSDAFHLITRIGQWLLFGLPFGGFPDVNNVRILIVNGGVVWTLTHEWLFYLLLPALAILAKHLPKYSLLFVLLLFGAHPLARFSAEARLYPSFLLNLCSYFAAGMTTAYLTRLNPDHYIRRALYAARWGLIPGGDGFTGHCLEAVYTTSPFAFCLCEHRSGPFPKSPTAIARNTILGTGELQSLPNERNRDVRGTQDLPETLASGDNLARALSVGLPTYRYPRHHRKRSLFPLRRVAVPKKDGKTGRPAGGSIVPVPHPL